MKEILPRIFHWTRPHPRIEIPVSSYYLEEEGILIADLDMSAIARSKFDFDVTGHYARPDVFKLEIDESPQPPVRTGEG